MHKEEGRQGRKLYERKNRIKTSLGEKDKFPPQCRLGNGVPDNRSRVVYVVGKLRLKAQLSK